MLVRSVVAAMAQPVSRLIAARIAGGAAGWTARFAERARMLAQARIAEQPFRPRTSWHDARALWPRFTKDR